MASPTSKARRVKLKWQPLAAMVFVIALGTYLVWSPISGRRGPSPRQGAHTVPMQVGNERGYVEVNQPVEGEPTFRLLLNNGFASNDLPADEFRRCFGEEAYRAATQTQNDIFRVFNILSWGSLMWVAIGLLGQVVFSGRMFVQWVASEKQRASVVPNSFWWMSLVGGMMLFAYFVWRQDFVGVLGQSSGVVIYARNLRLIYNERRKGLYGVGGRPETPAL